MRTPGARIAIGIATVAAVVVLFIVFTGGDDDNDNKGSTTTTTTQAAQDGTTTKQTETTVEATPQITIRDGKPVGGVKKLDYNKGDRIKFIVTSDVADEIHVHGYDVKQEVAAGGSVRFSFPASIEGVFEVELEERKQQIAQLKVEP